MPDNPYESPATFEKAHDPPEPVIDGADKTPDAGELTERVIVSALVRVFGLWLLLYGAWYLVIGFVDSLESVQGVNAVGYAMFGVVVMLIGFACIKRPRIFTDFAFR
jgi:hypothetical protein